MSRNVFISIGQIFLIVDDLNTVQRIDLEVSERERDLGVFVSSDLQMEQTCMK